MNKITLTKEDEIDSWIRDMSVWCRIKGNKPEVCSSSPSECERVRFLDFLMCSWADGEDEVFEPEHIEYVVIRRDVIDIRLKSQLNDSVVIRLTRNELDPIDILMSDRCSK